MLGHYEIVPLGDSGNLWSGDCDEAILIDGTRLFFKEGMFLGSKADLPEGLKHWGVGGEKQAQP